MLSVLLTSPFLSLKASKMSSKLCKVYMEIEIDVPDFSDERIVLGFTLPATYPSVPPQYFIRSSAISRDAASRIISHLVDMYHQSRADGEESNFVFGAAEWIREHIVEVAPQSSIATNGTETSGRHGNELVCPEIVHGEPFVDRKSRFVAHVAHISHPDQVQLVIAELYKDKKVATATHNIVAYRVDVSGGSGDGGPTSVCEHRDDDGESGAGEPMLHMMKNINAINLVVVVTRWFGGIELGPDRFKIITNVAKQLLLQVMEADKQLTDEEEARRRNTKMRPMTEVIARLKYDPGYSERLSSIVVGVLDGTDKIKPISFSEMEGYSTDSSLLNLVQWIKLNDDVIWDRQARIDKIFG